MIFDGVMDTLVTAHEAPWLGVSPSQDSLHGPVPSTDWLAGEHLTVHTVLHGKPQKTLHNGLRPKRIRIAHTLPQSGNMAHQNCQH